MVLVLLEYAHEFKHDVIIVRLFAQLARGAPLESDPVLEARNVCALNGAGAVAGDDEVGQ